MIFYNLWFFCLQGIFLVIYKLFPFHSTTMRRLISSGTEINVYYKYEFVVCYDIPVLTGEVHISF